MDVWPYRCIVVVVLCMMQAIKFIPYVIYAVRVPQNVNYC